LGQKSVKLIKQVDSTGYDYIQIVLKTDFDKKLNPAVKNVIGTLVRFLINPAGITAHGGLSGMLLACR
jgi:hypothetical protein